MNRTKLNYWVDLAIGIAGVLSAISGLVLLLPGDPTAGTLGISYQLWSGLHTWSSLAAIAGVMVHFLLHWKWMTAVTKQIFSPQRQPGKAQETSESVAGLAYGHATSSGLSRRAFLILGGVATVAAASVLAGYKAIFDSDTAQASLNSAGQLSATAQEGGVACPFGLINDPYPGRCRRYVDSNGDGVCDYSVPGSGNNSSSGSGNGFSEGFRHRPGFGKP